MLDGKRLYHKNKETAQIQSWLSPFTTLAMAFNVMHLKRDNGMIIDEDNDVPNVEQIRGTQGVESYSDLVIGLHRNPGAVDKILQNTLTVHVLADRASGNKTGNSFKLKYNPRTKMLQE